MLATTTKYAIRAILEVVRIPDGDFIRVEDLANRTKIPRAYLSKLIKFLVKEDFLEARKGPGGGVRLSPRGIKSSFYDVGLVTKEPLLKQNCFLNRSACDSKSPCPFHDEWRKIAGEIADFLKRTKIETFAKEKNKKPQHD